MALDRDCVLWFIWLLTLIQTIGDIEAWMLLENSKSIFSFLQPLFPSVSDSAGHINKRLWDKYVYRRREVRVFFSLEASNLVCFICIFEFKSIARPGGSLIPLARNYLHVWVILCQINEKRRDVYPSIHSL